jgi:phosphoribosylglycinamide formyltransferase-1
MKARIAVLVSGGGTNLQALIDARDRGELPHGELALVVSNKEGALPLKGRRMPAFPWPCVSGQRANRGATSRRGC